MVNEQANEPDNDLTEGWPDEPGNEELAELARRLRSSRPALSNQAMARIAQAMRREMTAHSPGGGRRRLLRPAAAAAAAAVLAVGTHLHFRANGPPAAPPSDQTTQGRRAGLAAGAAGAQDSYRVYFASPPAPPPDGPLLSLEEYKSLYTDLR